MSHRILAIPFRRLHARLPLLLLGGLVSLAACGGGDRQSEAQGSTASSAPSQATVDSAATEAAAPSTAKPGPREPNEMGLIPVLEYHVITRSEAEGKSEFHRTAAEFRSDLEELYRRGYRPVSIAEVLDKKIDQVLPAGYAAFVPVFDDASPSQFRWIERNGKLELDPNSAVGIWMDFAKKHPDWRNAGTFCVLSNAEAGRAFFGNKEIEGQKTEWRFKKIQWLVEQGFEICNHTQWHARLDKYPDAFVQEQIARLQIAVDSAVPGYKIRTFALPLGMWPKNRALAWRGSWTDPKSGQAVAYKHDAVLEVSGGPNVSPHDPKFDPHSIDRVIAYKNSVVSTLDRLDKGGKAYVSDGNPKAVAKPAAAAQPAGQ